MDLIKLIFVVILGIVAFIAGKSFFENKSSV